MRNYIISTLAKNIKKMTSPSLEDIGLWIVRIRIMGGDNQSTIQIMVDRLDGTPVDVNNCTEASHIISALMDVEDPIMNAYDLEVSTPGIDRPLVRAQDWEKYIGFETKVELITPTPEGRRRYRGFISVIKDGAITLMVDQKDEIIKLENIEHAKLMMNDELVEFCQQEMKAMNSDFEEEQN